MAANLLSLLNEQFTPHVIDQLSAKLNENPAGVRKAVEASVPALLGGLVRKVQTGNGASDVISVLKDGNYANTPLDISQVADSRSKTQAAAASGSSLLDAILGSDAGPISESIARYSGVNGHSALTTMGLAGASLMNLLGLQHASQGLSDDNLRTLLAGQIDTIRRGIPSGLSGLEERLGLADQSTQTGGQEEVQGMTNFTSTPVNPNIPKTPQVDLQKSNNWQRWVLLAAGLLIIVMLIQKCREPQSGTGGITDTTQGVQQQPRGDVRTPASGANVPEKLREAGDSTK